MTVTRSTSSTSAQALMELERLVSSGTARICLFATELDDVETDLRELESPEGATIRQGVGHPLLAAIVQEGPNFLIFDGIKTAEGEFGSSEFQSLMEVASDAETVRVGTRPIDFTGTLLEEHAAEYLLQVPTIQLTKDMRSQFDEMLFRGT